MQAIVNETTLLKSIKESNINPNIINDNILKELLKKYVEEKDQEKLKVFLQDPTLELKDTELIMGKDFNEYNKFYPEGITHLTFGQSFNQDIKGAIPNSVTHLTFGMCFNQNIHEAIPNSVTHLTFGDSFNQNIKGNIPQNVTHLFFGVLFNQDIKGAIPNGVTHLTFENHFNQDIKGALPNGLTHLTFIHGCYVDIKGALPKSIIELVINNLKIDLAMHPEYYIDESSEVIKKDNSFYRYQNTIFYKNSIVTIKKITDSIQIKLISGDILEIDQSSDVGKEFMKIYFE